MRSSIAERGRAARRWLLIALAALTLAGCEVYAPAEPEEIARARYVSDEPPSITLVSMVNARTGRSAHAGLLINGSQRVLYDPAGTFTHPDLPRSADIHYGMTPRFVDYYERYHARFDYFVESQEVPVTRAQADQVYANAVARGQSFKMECALTAGAVLQPVPPFQNVRTTFFPNSLREDFASIPGVVTRTVYETDLGRNNVWEQDAADQAAGY